LHAGILGPAGRNQLTGCPAF